ncbi:NAD-dependent dehydratase [Listeria newyorkensis]|uniref:UDP-glucose 4-epimerase n=1 Tax=Listeria newyorkensis TaxID=1497681 RepID=A0ABX4XQD3_9LIST|nr:MULTISPECIES: NAD-dependent epimerase/dehydratase family protein [Listeria]PNP89014.1 NAD-dependent dehydratase [Listeria newyorkensis]RQW65658.1 NAD-dependent epimerase/dehydratase family protein [Listeria sp. SHR_NRA_18]WAO20764.1 NAD-dependent epimerase/dehydratase family protein [Listeria newyorkensis]SQC55219.1 NAD dependent epimerase/dehydratase family [Listeria newyorkensis]
MKILVFGGTRFFGKKLVTRLLADGHDVTIATRGKATDDFGDAVKRVKMNRESREALFCLAQENWDVVYDNICFSPQDALYSIAAFRDKVGKYVYTSSLSVYRMRDRALVEADFDPFHYELVTGSREDFDYGEGKRLAEAVFFQKANFPVVAVRFPIVLGEDDYTGRLEFHIKHVQAGEEIGMPNEEAEMGFISSDEAADFLCWVGTKSDIVGPINATSDSVYRLSELMGLIEDATGKTAIVEEITEDNDDSPFGVEKTYYLDNAKAKEAGFAFQDLHEWLPKLIDAKI